jgi:hypothetical protein
VRVCVYVRALAIRMVRKKLQTVTLSSQCVCIKCAREMRQEERDLAEPNIGYAGLIAND